MEATTENRPNVLLPGEWGKTDHTGNAAGESASPDLPGKWGELYDQLVRDRLNHADTYVTANQLEFRTGTLAELSARHGTSLAQHTIGNVLGESLHPVPRGSTHPAGPEAIVERYEASPEPVRQVATPMPERQDTVLYLCAKDETKDETDIFLDKESWAKLAETLGPAKATFSTLASNPGLLAGVANHMLAHTWGDGARLIRMRTLPGSRSAMRIRALLPEDYVRLDSIYLLPQIYRTLWQLEGPRLDVGGIVHRVSPDGMLLSVSASETMEMTRLNERFAVGMMLYNSEVDPSPPLEIELIMTRLVCLNGMTATEKAKFVTIRRNVPLGRKVFPGLPPLVLDPALQREINALVDEAIRISWAHASRVREDIEQRIDELTQVHVEMTSRDAVRHAVSELARQTAMRFVPGVVVDDIVDAYFAEVERENQRIENREITERVIDGTAWGLYNAFTYYTTHIAPRRRLATARSLHRHGRKFHGRIDWDRVRERASPHQGCSRRKVYLDPPRI